MEEGRSAIWARLDGVEREYLRVCAERDRAIAERDAALNALRPLLEQIEGLRTAVLGQLPKKDSKLPSARDGKRRYVRREQVAKPKGQGARVPRCKECNLPLDSPALTQSNVPPTVDGVCGLCQFIADDLAEERAKAKGGNGNGR